MSNYYIEYFRSNKFILQGHDKQVNILDDNNILRQGDYDYYNKEDTGPNVVKLLHQAQLISPRIAQYYPHIATYKLSCENLIYCPNNKPHIRYWKGRGADEPSNIVYATCSDEVILGETRLPVNVYRPNSSYKPRTGFQTGIKINGAEEQYDLLTYNQPFIYYGRDYYIFLPYEWDPIAKLVYAFSI
jgi:hypothetical protein